VSQDVIQVRGDTAIVLTTLGDTRVMKVGGDSTAFENKYLDVLRRKVDGGWEFAYHMWNSNLP
jgi:ketosteroid isomerase-like protein